MLLSLQSAFVFLITTLVVLGVVVRWMLRPLKLIERQAREVAQRRFPRIEKLPKTREFAQVAEAMNFMTGAVESFINDQSEQARRLQRDAYEDSVTGLRNRAAAELDIRQLTRHARDQGVGAMMFVGVQGLDAINKRGGYDAGDAFMRDVAAALAKHSKPHDALLARYAGAVFCVIVQKSTPEQAQELADHVAQCRLTAR